MKKVLFSLLTLIGSLCAFANGQDAQITSTPSPAVSNKPLEVTVSTGDMGTEVYCYTWCSKINGESKAPSWGWGDVHTSKFKMTGSGGTYKFSISNIKEFYGLKDSELEGLTELGFIAKTSGGQQTKDLFVSVEQGRRDAYSGGEGTADSPFIIRTSNDLNMLATTPSDWSAGTCFLLETDIDGSALTSPIGSVSSPFAGTFDGNGSSIKNIRISTSTLGTPAGLFGCINGGTVKCLGVTNATVSGSAYAGALVGQLVSGRIERCFSTGLVTGTSVCVGGLVGLNESGIIINSYSGAEVENRSDYATGGIVGKNLGTIQNTYAAGRITGYDYVGGVAGANYGAIKNSFALNVEVTAPNDFAARFGGNNNGQNNVEGNYSWDNILAGHTYWTQHGDHSELMANTVLQNMSQFKTMSRWDFGTVWEWRQEGTKEYPVLRGLSNQECVLSDRYFDDLSSIEDFSGDMLGIITVGPNPTYGELTITAERGVASYTVYSVNGHIVAQGCSCGESAVTVDLSGHASGLYLVRVADADSRTSINKIIKK